MSSTPKKLVLQAVEASDEVFTELESRGLIKRFLDNDTIKEEPEKYRVTDIYRTDKSLGSHKLIKVCFNMAEPVLGWHEDNEDFILIKDPEKDYKPLYIVIALFKEDELNRKIDSGKLENSDIMLIRLKYNNPFLSFFTMYGHVPHCELTVSSNCLSGKNIQAPVFFVTEPSNLGNFEIEMKGYRIETVLDVK